MNPSDIVQHYLESCAWAESGDPDAPLGKIAPYFSEDAKRRALSVCESFIHDNPDVDACGLGPDQIGHDLWLTSQGHGAGFWDRGLSYAMGQRLSQRAGLERMDVYVGDDGLAYFG